jgi:hypothetical protein
VTARNTPVIWVEMEAENLSRQGWTAFGDLPDGQFSARF